MNSTPVHLSHYRLLRKLGEGGFGTVYLAEDVRLRRRVALKLLPATLSPDPRARERLLAEARTVAALEHPNVCALYDFDDRGARPFLVMQLVDGETLADALARGPLEEARTAEIVTAVSEALVAAHARGIVHRDVKCANILLARDGTAKLADFGVALLKGSSPPSSYAMIGTPAYLAPEQIHGEPGTEASDQYSLGVVAYQCLTGRLPFAGDSMDRLLYAIESEKPEPPSRRSPGIATAWDEILGRAMAKEPAERFPSVREFIERVRREVLVPAPSQAGAAQARALVGSAHALYARYTHADNLRALEHYERAVATDPGSAPAWAGIADCCGQMHDKGWDVDPVWLERGEGAARRAIELDSGGAASYKALALIQHQRGELEQARGTLEQATGADPGYLPAHVNLAAVLRGVGDLAGAERSLRRALAIDPDEPFVLWAMAHLLLFTRRHAASVAFCDRFQGCGTSPYYQLRARVWKACAHAYLRDSSAAQGEIEEGRAMGLARFGIGSAEALLAAISGKRRRARQLIADLEIEVVQHLPFCWILAEAAAWCGDERTAARLLSPAARSAMTEFALVRVLPGLARMAERRYYREWIGDRGCALVWPLEAPPLAPAERAQFTRYGEASGLP